MTKTQVAGLLKWIKERHSIYFKKTTKEPKPWTKDPIFQTYKFCNVYRELDRVSTWVRVNWRTPHKNDPDVWFAMAVSVLVNWPDTMAELGYPVPWNLYHFIKTLAARKSLGEKVFTGAYIIHSIGESKPRYIADKVLTPMWKNRESIRPRAGDTLASFYGRLHECRDMGSFMAGQVVALTKHVGHLRKAKDFWTWAISGPGSRRGLNRVLGYHPDEHWTEGGWQNEFAALYDHVVPVVWRDYGMPRLFAQDLQNCLCEYDKYERVRLGEGRPRSLYPGLPETKGLFE